MYIVLLLSQPLSFFQQCAAVQFCSPEFGAAAGELYWAWQQVGSAEGIRSFDNFDNCQHILHDTTDDNCVLCLYTQDFIMATGGGAGGGGGGGGHDADYNAMADRFAAMRASDARDRLDRLRGMKPGAAPTTDSLEARMRQVRDAVYPSNACFLTPGVVVATLSTPLCALYQSLARWQW